MTSWSLGQSMGLHPIDYRRQEVESRGATANGWGRWAVQYSRIASRKQRGVPGAAAAPNQTLHLTGAALPFSRDIKLLQGPSR